LRIAATGAIVPRMYAPLSDAAGPPDVYIQSAPPPPPTQRLEGPTNVAVAVIGAGFTGLSAALNLAEAGIDVAVLEAKDIGWGASGRAFGQVVPYLKLGHDAILRHYGPERGQRIVDAVAAGPDLVFELIARHGIECWPMRSGLIFAAHSPSGRRDLERRTRYWQQRGAPVEDLNEAFFIDRERSPDDLEVRAVKPFRELNKWPADLPGFREMALAYYARLEAFAKSLLPLFAIALDLPADWFDAPFTDAQCTLRLSHYPPTQYADNQFGISPHTDSSFLTILPQSNLEGLYIRPAKLGWMKAPNIPGSFIVNSGDMCRRWSNDRFLSTEQPRDQSGAGSRPLRRAVLLCTEHRLADPVPAHVLQCRQPAALPGRNLRAVSALVSAQQLPRPRRCRGDDGEAIGRAMPSGPRPDAVRHWQVARPAGRLRQQFVAR
jgi:FAD dependent oxidoreductase/2OG-Fe(II) oxygenase superfamily